MKMQLVDAELKQAVANYVRDVIGINITGKTVSASFSATRKEGVITDVEITGPVASNVVLDTPVAIPGYNDEAEPVNDPADPEVAAAAQAEATLGDPVQEAETLVEAVPEETPVAPVKATTATLFGKPAA
jgi:hypothetical protein